MKTAMMGPLRVHATGGSDGEGGGDGPAVLLCHGFGAPGDDLVALARVVDAGRGVRWFFPEAPLALDLGYGMMGRAWWPIDMVRLQEMIARGRARDLAQETPEGLAEARAALEGCLAALEAERGVRRDRLILGGFSQGAMITTEVCLHAEASPGGAAPFAGLAVLSGSMLCEDRWRPAAARGALSGLRALVSHGRADPLLPFAGAEELRALLEQAGAEVEWVPHGGQHEIPYPVLERLAALVRRCFPQF